MDISNSIEKAKKYIDGLTVNSPVNVPEKVLAGGFFSWDNEKRCLPAQPYLFQWSYYNGVVFEGLYDIYLANGDKKYKSYVLSYLDGLIDEDGKFIFERAGYVDYHGADCYKTAALLCRFAGESGKFDKVLKDLYRDLTDPEHKNENGHVISKEFCDKTLGGNYWHSWRNGNPPKRYKLWLDGIYMLQPFIARYAALIGDKAQALKIADRLEWVCDNMQSENGLYFHAANSEKDLCPFFWTRATGWYCMALVDVAEAFSGKEGKEAERVVSVCKRALQKFTEGIIPYREESGLWKNLADMPKTATNREEVSGTSMIVYAILKGIRLGILDKKYAQIAKEGFVGMCETKLDEGLKDIYFKASASGVNNYETPEDYLTDEGKGVGPFIMAYSEIIRG